MKILKRASVAGAVMLATAGVAVGTAQADSLLAPLVISTTNTETYFNFKMPGSGGTNSDNIHYTWIQKGTILNDLRRNPGDVDINGDAVDDLLSPCDMYNNTGQGSKNDMIMQSSRGVSATPNGLHTDRSRPRGFTSGNFVGMTVITDTTNMPMNVGGSVPSEGGLSGFSYIVNHGTGDVETVKLLNNHRSLLDGDFSSGFTSNKSVDLAWMGSFTSPTPILAFDRNGDGVVDPITDFPPIPYFGATVETMWTLMVTGPDMAQDGGLFSSTYDPTVTLSQNTRTANGVIDATQDSPQAAMSPYGTKGVMNNDEGFSSGNVSVTVRCMGTFSRSDLMNASLMADTRFGGWTRLSISTQDGATGGSPHRASGAMIYRGDIFNVRPKNGIGPITKTEVSLAPETAGHLKIGKNHPNRPF